MKIITPEVSKNKHIRKLKNHSAKNQKIQNRIQLLLF